MSRRVVIEIGRRELRAVDAIRQGDTLRVRRTLAADLPTTVDTRDAGALGAWVGDQLRSAGFSNGRVTVALGREEVGLKRVDLPTTDASELPDMTRLALRREMPFDAEQAVIDFVPVARNETSTRVVAVAAPRQVIDHTRGIVRAAGLSVGRVGLRAMGAVAILRTWDAEREGAVLVVDVTGDSVEFCVLGEDGIRFSRAASLPRDAVGTDLAELVVTEVRRTWMSYRIVEGEEEVTQAVLMGDQAVTRAAAGPVAELLSAEVVVLDHHPRVEANGQPLDRLWPLAGLLIEPDLGEETIDFARSRRSVDRGARRRRSAIIAAGLVVLTVLAAWTTGRHQLRTLEQRLTTARQRQSALLPRYARLQRDAATVAHLRRWETADVRWLDHLECVLETLPPAARAAVLNEWIGSLEFRGVRYDKRTKEWSAPAELMMVLDGEAADRATADAIRESFVESDRYTITSSGADSEGGRRLPFGYTYRLHARELDGPRAEPEPPPARAQAGAAR